MVRVHVLLSLALLAATMHVAYGAKVFRAGEASVTTNNQWYFLGGIPTSESFPEISVGTTNSFGVVAIEQHNLPTDFSSPNRILSPGINRWGHVSVDYFNPEEGRTFVYLLGGSASVSTGLTNPQLRVVQFDPENGVWTYLEEETKQIHYSAGVVVEGGILFWPGLVRGESGPRQQLDYFNLTSKSFQQIGLLPVGIPQANVALEEVGDVLYVVGGRYHNGASWSTSNGVYTFDVQALLAHSDPETVVPLPTAVHTMSGSRSMVATTLLDASLLMIGGFDGTGAAVNTFEALNLIDNSISIVDTLPVLPATGALQVTEFDGSVYMAGGRSCLEGAGCEDDGHFLRLDDGFFLQHLSQCAKGKANGVAVLAQGEFLALSGAPVQSTEGWNVPLLSKVPDFETLSDPFDHTAGFYEPDDGDVYVYGGRDPATGVFTDTLRRYNVLDRSWEQISYSCVESCPGARAGHTFIRRDNSQAWLLGGSADAALCETLFSFNFNTHTFSNATRNWPCLFHHTAEFNNGYYIVAGGLSGVFERTAPGQVSDWVGRAGFSLTDTPEDRQPLPYHVYKASSLPTTNSFLLGQALIVGGFDENGDGIATVLVQNDEDDPFLLFTDSSFQFGVGGAFVVSSHGELYAAYGATEDSEDEILDGIQTLFRDVHNNVQATGVPPCENLVNFPFVSVTSCASCDNLNGVVLSPPPKDLFTWTNTMRKEVFSFGAEFTVHGVRALNTDSTIIVEETLPQSDSVTVYYYPPFGVDDITDRIVFDLDAGPSEQTIDYEIRIWPQKIWYVSLSDIAPEAHGDPTPPFPGTSWNPCDSWDCVLNLASVDDWIRVSTRDMGSSTSSTWAIPTQLFLQARQHVIGNGADMVIDGRTVQWQFSATTAQETMWTGVRAEPAWLSFAANGFIMHDGNEMRGMRIELTGDFTAMSATSRTGSFIIAENDFIQTVVAASTTSKAVSSVQDTDSTWRFSGNTYGGHFAVGVHFDGSNNADIATSGMQVDQFGSDAGWLEMVNTVDSSASFNDYSHSDIVSLTNDKFTARYITIKDNTNLALEISVTGDNLDPVLQDSFEGYLLVEGNSGTDINFAADHVVSLSQGTVSFYAIAIRNNTNYSGGIGGRFVWDAGLTAFSFGIPLSGMQASIQIDTNAIPIYVEIDELFLGSGGAHIAGNQRDVGDDYPYAVTLVSTGFFQLVSVPSNQCNFYIIDNQHSILMQVEDFLLFGDTTSSIAPAQMLIQGNSVGDRLSPAVEVQSPSKLQFTKALLSILDNIDPVEFIGGANLILTRAIIEIADNNLDGHWEAAPGTTPLAFFDVTIVADGSVIPTPNTNLNGSPRYGVATLQLWNNFGAIHFQRPIQMSHELSSALFPASAIEIINNSEPYQFNAVEFREEVLLTDILPELSHLLVSIKDNDEPVIFQRDVEVIDLDPQLIPCTAISVESNVASTASWAVEFQADVTVGCSSGLEILSQAVGVRVLGDVETTGVSSLAGDAAGRAAILVRNSETTAPVEFRGSLTLAGTESSGSFSSHGVFLDTNEGPISFHGPVDGQRAYRNTFILIQESVNVDFFGDVFSDAPPSGTLKGGLTIVDSTENVTFHGIFRLQNARSFNASILIKESSGITFKGALSLSDSSKLGNNDAVFLVSDNWGFVTFEDSTALTSLTCDVGGNQAHVRITANTAPITFVGSFTLNNGIGDCSNVAGVWVDVNEDGVHWQSTFTINENSADQIVHVEANTNDDDWSVRFDGQVSISSEDIDNVIFLEENLEEVIFGSGVDLGAAGATGTWFKHIGAEGPRTVPDFSVAGDFSIDADSPAGDAGVVIQKSWNATFHGTVTINTNAVFDEATETLGANLDGVAFGITETRSNNAVIVEKAITIENDGPSVSIPGGGSSTGSAGIWIEGNDGEVRFDGDAVVKRYYRGIFVDANNEFSSVRFSGTVDIYESYRVSLNVRDSANVLFLEDVTVNEVADAAGADLPAMAIVLFNNTLVQFDKNVFAESGDNTVPLNRGLVARDNAEVFIGGDLTLIDIAAPDVNPDHYGIWIRGENEIFTVTGKTLITGDATGMYFLGHKDSVATFKDTVDISSGERQAIYFDGGAQGQAVFESAVTLVSDSASHSVIEMTGGSPHFRFLNRLDVTNTNLGVHGIHIHNTVTSGLPVGSADLEVVGPLNITNVGSAGLFFDDIANGFFAGSDITISNTAQTADSPCISSDDASVGFIVLGTVTLDTCGAQGAFFALGGPVGIVGDFNINNKPTDCLVQNNPNSDQTVAVWGPHTGELWDFVDVDGTLTTTCPLPPT